MLSVNPSAWHTGAVASAHADDTDTRVQAWLASLQSDNTRAAYRRDLVVFLAWLQSVRVAPRKVTVTHVERFARHLDDQGSSDATVRRRMAAVASFYRHAGPAWSMANPATDADRPAAGPDAPAAVLTPAEAAAVWKAATELGSKTALVVGLVLLDGYKTHELLRFDAADLRRVGDVYSVVDANAPAGAPPEPLDAADVGSLASLHGFAAHRSAVARRQPHPHAGAAHPLRRGLPGASRRRTLGCVEARHRERAPQHAGHHMEPRRRIELLTYALRVRCSTD